MIRLLLLLLVLCRGEAFQVSQKFDPDKGLYLGELRKDEVGLSAKVFALSSSLILLSDVQIDPHERGVFIFAGTLGEDGSYTKVGYPLKLINGKVRPLHLIASDLKNSDESIITLKFPDKETIFNVDWIAAISRKERDVYSRILLEEDVRSQVPRSKILPGLVKGPQVLSPHLLYSDQRTLEVLDFNYTPLDEGTIFRAILKKGSSKEDEMLICSQPIAEYANTTLTLKLPDGTQAYRLTALELYSLKSHQSITYSIFPESLNLSILPPSLIQLGLLHDEGLGNEIQFTDDCEASLAILKKKETTTTVKPMPGTRRRTLPKFEHFPEPKDSLESCGSDCEKEVNVRESTLVKPIRKKYNRGALKNRRYTAIKKVPRKTATNTENKTELESNPRERITPLKENKDIIPGEVYDYDDQNTGEGFHPRMEYPKRPHLRRNQLSTREKTQLSRSQYLKRDFGPSAADTSTSTAHPHEPFHTTTIQISQFNPSRDRYSDPQEVPPPPRGSYGGPRRPIRRRRPPPEEPEAPIGFRIRNRDYGQFSADNPEPFPSANPPRPRGDVLAPRSDQELETEPTRPRAENPIHNFFSFISKPRHWFQGHRPSSPGSNRLEEPLINLKRNRDTMAYLQMQERAKQRHGFRRRFLTPSPHDQRNGQPKLRVSSRRNGAPIFHPTDSEFFGREKAERNISVVPHELLSKSISSPSYHDNPQAENRFDPLKINSESGFKPIVKGPGNQPLLAFNVMERTGPVYEDHSTLDNNQTFPEELYAKEPVRITPSPQAETSTRDYLKEVDTPYDEPKGNTFIYSYSQNTTPIPEVSSPLPATASRRTPTPRIGLRVLPVLRVDKFHSADFDSFTQLPRVPSSQGLNKAYYTPYNERDRIDDPNQPLLYTN